MKNKEISLGLCCIGFIGFGGLHDFYLENYGKGLLKFFTANFFVIGTIIDLVRLLTDSYDEKIQSFSKASNESIKEIRLFHCFYCDNIVNEKDEFCSRCGKKLRHLNNEEIEEHFEIETVEEIDNLDGLEFENYCAELLKKNGYNNVKVTPASNDYGIDILCEKDNIKYAIQCKNYSSQLGNKCIQEAYSGKQYYNCHVGVVLTNNYFTHNAEQLAQKNGILLWDRNTLLKLMESEK